MASTVNSIISVSMELKTYNAVSKIKKIVKENGQT
jgi:hypothetical protein